MIRAFLFDLDGTLIDSERDVAEVVVRALARDHVPPIVVEQYDRDFVIGRSWIAIYDSLRARYPQLAWTRDELLSRARVMREEVAVERGVAVLPGAHAALAWTRGAPRALVTGSSRAEVAQLLPRIGADARFDVIVAAEDVARSKPAPDGYLAAIAELRVPAADCVVIEDSVAGIAAGRAAGCVVVAVRAGNFGGWSQDAAHVVIDTLADFTPDLVDRLGRL